MLPTPLLLTLFPAPLLLFFALFWLVLLSVLGVVMMEFESEDSFMAFVAEEAAAGDGNSLAEADDACIGRW